MTDTTAPSTPRRPRRRLTWAQVRRTAYRLLAAPLVVSTLASAILGLRIVATDVIGSPLPPALSRFFGPAVWWWLVVFAPVPAYILFSGVPTRSTAWRWVRCACGAGLALCLVYPGWALIQSLWWVAAR